MARLITLLEQDLDRMPPTVVTQATTWWETVLALVKQKKIGLGGHLPVKVCYYTLCTCGPFMTLLCLMSVHEVMALIGDAKQVRKSGPIEIRLSALAATTL